MTTERAAAKPPGVAEASSPGGSVSALIGQKARPRQRPEPVLHQARTPDLVGRALLDAQRLARMAGFSISVTVWETKIGPWGQVLSQQPIPGAKAPTGTAVNVVVAGRPHVTLPDLRGLDAHAAVGELRRLGLVPGGREERGSLTIPSGSVIGTRPAGGSLVVDGSPVTLVVSRGRPSAPRGRVRTSTGSELASEIVAGVADKEA